MKINELQVKSHKAGKRVGRGIGSGKGKTSGRGTKGQNARTGGGVRPGFEGGQNPWSRRMPKKRGFASLSRTTFQVVNVGSLEQFKDGSMVDPIVLAKAGLIKKVDQPVKILGDGNLSRKLTVKATAATASAVAAISKAGGKLELTVKAVSDKPAKKEGAAK